MLYEYLLFSQVSDCPFNQNLVSRTRSAADASDRLATDSPPQYSMHNINVLLLIHTGQHCMTNDAKACTAVDYDNSVH